MGEYICSCHRKRHFEISKKFEQKFPRLHIDILRAHIKFCEKVSFLVTCVKNTQKSHIDNFFLHQNLYFLHMTLKIPVFRGKTLWACIISRCTYQNSYPNFSTLSKCIYPVCQNTTPKLRKANLSKPSFIRLLGSAVYNLYNTHVRWHSSKSPQSQLI
jgi:hypothetical protein